MFRMGRSQQHWFMSAFSKPVSRSAVVSCPTGNVAPEQPVGPPAAALCQPGPSAAICHGPAVRQELVEGPTGFEEQKCDGDVFSSTISRFNQQRDVVIVEGEDTFISAGQHTSDLEHER